MEYTVKVPGTVRLLVQACTSILLNTVPGTIVLIVL